MGIRITRTVFLLISLVAVGAAAFRVATAPDRVRERRETARSVCAQTGGEWIKVDNDEICRRPGDTLNGI